jgi:type IV pilus biogenesis protein CpaD/CtpE
MKKLILASVSGIALMGLAACSDTDSTTTQTVPESNPPAQTEPMATPPASPATPSTMPAPTTPATPPAQ